MALITITSSYGAGGQRIAEKVSRQLGVELFDDHKIQERTLAMGISADDVSGLDEKAPGLFDRLFTNKPAIYLELLGAVVYDIASSGQGVIIGHAAQVFLKDFNCAFHVRVHASETNRGRWLAREQDMNEAASVNLVRKMDRRFKEFIQYGFNRDWNDLSEYDLVLNLDKIGDEWAVRLIRDLSESDEVKECSLGSLEAMEFSSLQRKVEAAVIKNNLTSPFGSFQVEVTGKGKVHLSGIVYNNDERKRLLEVVKDVKGVTGVISDVSIMPPSY
ncbi:MAG: cytidylate kinase family protein [Thermodesulfobacteriota bacterium]